MKNTKMSKTQSLRFAFSMMRDKRLPLWMKAAVPFAAMVYVISPIDLIPDFIAGFGQVDDLAMVVMAIGLLGSFLQKVAPANVVIDHLSTLFSQAQPETVRVRQEPDIIDVEFRVVDRSN